MKCDAIIAATMLLQLLASPAARAQQNCTQKPDPARPARRCHAGPLARLRERVGVRVYDPRFR